MSSGIDQANRKNSHGIRNAPAAVLGGDAGKAPEVARPDGHADPGGYDPPTGREEVGTGGAG